MRSLPIFQRYKPHYDENAQMAQAKAKAEHNNYGYGFILLHGCWYDVFVYKHTGHDLAETYDQNNPCY